MCPSLGGRMPQKMSRKMMTVFVVNHLLSVMKIYQSVAHVILKMCPSCMPLNRCNLDL